MALILKSRRRAASCQRHERIALDVEAFVSATLLRFPPGQRDVDRRLAGSGTRQLVDGEALAHRLDAAERAEQCWQAILWNAEHLDVDVLRRLAAQPVAHPAADDEGAPARLAHGPRDVEGERWGLEGMPSDEMHSSTKRKGQAMCLALKFE